MVRLTLTILCGTRAGQRIVVACGETLRVGRTVQANLVVSDDPTMSARHFELECGQNTVLVRDLHSRNRLFLNGEAVTEALLADGDQLRAGRTFFSVSIVDPLAPRSVPDLADETHAPSPLDATYAERRVPVPSAVPGTEALPAATLFPGQLAGLMDDDDTADGFASGRCGVLSQRDPSVRLYAIVERDAGSEIVERARRDQRRAASLAFIGPTPYHSEVVPLLVELDAGRLNDSWHVQPPRILIESAADFDQLYAHLRGVFCPADDENGPAFFHCHEPDQLFQWLKRRGPLDLANLFTCVSGIWLDISSTGRYHRFAHLGDELIEKLI